MTWVGLAGRVSLISGTLLTFFEARQTRSKWLLFHHRPYISSPQLHTKPLCWGGVHGWYMCCLEFPLCSPVSCSWPHLLVRGCVPAAVHQSRKGGEWLCQCWCCCHASGRSAGASRVPPEGRPGMSDVTLLSGISGLSFDSPFLSPLLFFPAWSSCSVLSFVC